MSNYKYAIKKLPIKSWIKYWLWRNRTGGTKYKFALSDIKEGTNFYLENTIKRKFNMFEIYGKTTQNGTPTPENPIPIVNITGNINEKIQNANLIDLKSYLIEKRAEYTENEDGSFTIKLKQSMYSEPLEFSDENIVVSLSGLITNVTSNNFRIQLLTKNNGSAGLIDENTQVLNNKSASKLRFDWSGSQGGTVTMKNIMLNKGSTALPYIPHAEQNISFPLEEGQYLAEGDYLADDGIHHKRGKVVLDGSEDWKLWSIGLENVERFYLNIEGSNLSNSLCDKFSYIRDNSDQEHYRSSAMDGVYKQFVLFINKLRLSTINVAGLKAWLSENPIEVEYDLVTEVVEPFTEEQQIEYNKIKELYTYNEITNIDGDANLKIKYWERVER